MPSTTTNRKSTAAKTGSARPAASRTGLGHRRWWLAGAGVVILAGIIGGVYAFGQAGDGNAQGEAPPYVGGDLHVLGISGDRLLVGGHDGGAVSDDDGRTWTALDSLRGADPMGVAQTSDALLVGGHPGLYRSTDGGTTFSIASGENAIPDVHALGAAGDTVYLASPQAGFLVSDDGGATWQVRNSQVGQSFMGSIMVDPVDPQRLIAPDMANGVVTSTDGGATWSILGGPAGTMAAAWDPTDTDRIVSIGMSESGTSDDGGRTWTPLDVPAGTAAATFSSDGGTLYAAALEGTNAIIYASTDDGKSWTEL